MTAGRIYTAQFNDVTVSAAQDLFQLTASTSAAVEVLEVHVSQQTEFGDAAEEMLNIQVRSGSTTSGSGGSTPSMVKLSVGDASAGSSVQANNTTKANTTSNVIHGSYWWNLRMPFDLIYTPETTVVLAPARRLTVELVGAPVDAVDMSGFIVFKEIGG